MCMLLTVRDVLQSILKVLGSFCVSKNHCTSFEFSRVLASKLTEGSNVFLSAPVVVAYAFRSHNWSARQRHHRLQSVVWTSHRVVLSVGRIQQYVTSFGSHRRNTGRSL